MRAARSSVRASSATDAYHAALAEHEAAIRAETWDEAIDACAEQGTIQTPINPYKEKP